MRQSKYCQNGHNRSGSQQDLCKDCRAVGVLTPKRQYSEDQREEILRAYQERPSMRGISRIFGVSRNTLTAWIKKNFRRCRRRELTMCWKSMKPGVLCGSGPINGGCGRSCCVGRRIFWRLSWEIAASERVDGCPGAFRHCVSSSDFWDAYQAVFPKETHRCVGKDTGQTAHQERWYNTLRQRGGGAMCAKPCRFLNVRSGIIESPNGLS